MAGTPIAIIPVAGVGTRLRPHTHTLPNVLLHVAVKPILAHILDDLPGLGIQKAVLIVGYMGDLVREYVVRNYPNLDARFVEHEGFDWNGIQHAMDKNARRGRVVAGGSTITQQLAKNLFLSSERSYWRKGEEALITLMLEAVLDKRRIFEIYLNVIEWGSGIFGCEAAAHRYFGESAAQLSVEHAARLAAMAPNPRHYEKNPGSRGLALKIPIILARMPAAELP